MPKSLRKYIRREKARLRRTLPTEEAYEKAVALLYERVHTTKPAVASRLEPGESPR